MSNSPMHYRQAEISDLSNIMTIIEQARQTMLDLGTDQWQYGYPNEFVLKTDIAAGQCFVAEKSGTILGLAVLKDGPEAGYQRISGPGWLKVCRDGIRDCDYLVVHRLAVLDTARKQGVAQGLIGFAEKQAQTKGRQSVRIDTHRGNQPMQRLLEKNGYAYCGLVDLGPGQGDTAPDGI